MDPLQDILSKALIAPTTPAAQTKKKAALERVERGYIAKELVLCTLPHRDPGDVRAYTRKNGNFTLTIQPGYDGEAQTSFGVPYGIIPRMLFFWIISEAVSSRSRRIELGNTMNDFLREVGLDPKTGRGKRGDGARVKEQLRRLMNAQISFSYTEGNDQAGQEARGFLHIPKGYQFFWDFRNPDQQSFFNSYIELTQDFYEAILTSPVPIDTNSLRKLKRSPLAIDLYAWVCYRAYVLWETHTAAATITYQQLQWQFGSEYNRLDNFKHALIEAMEKIAPPPHSSNIDKKKYAYPELKYEFTARGLTLHRSRPAIAPTIEKEMARIGVKHTPKKGLSEDTYAQAKEIAPSWDVRALANDWKKWAEKTGAEIRNPDAHFLAFVKTHVKNNGA